MTIVFILLFACAGLGLAAPRMKTIVSRTHQKIDGIFRKQTSVEIFTATTLLFIALACFLLRLPLRYYVIFFVIAVIYAFHALRSHPDRTLLPGQATVMAILVAVSTTTWVLPRLQHAVAKSGQSLQCLSAALNDRGIGAIITDYGLAKPLRYLGGDATIQTITFDFELGRPALWIGPYQSVSGTAAAVVQRSAVCATRMEPQRSCATTWLSRHTDLRQGEVICQDYTLFRLNEAQTFTYDKNKFTSFVHRLRKNIDKFINHI